MSQKSAQLPAKHATLVVKNVSIPKPEGSQILIKLKSAAINPIDYKIQKAGRLYEVFPRVLGSDAAGIVEAVGPEQKQYKKGDRVISFIPIFSHTGAETRFGTFQEYTLTEEIGTTILPDNVSFDEGATIPLALSTAADGFYGVLGLEKPSLTPKQNGETVLVWGGASSVGQFAIQLAKAGGYRVITTGSKSGHQLLRSLGADTVLDYHDVDVVDQILKLTDRKLRHIYDAISTKPTIEQGIKCIPSGGTIAYTQLTPETANVECPSHVQYARVFAGSLLTTKKELGHEVFMYVGKALKSGQLKGNPVKLTDGGIDQLQAALDYYEKEGIQGAKFVFHP